MCIHKCHSVNIVSTFSPGHFTKTCSQEWHCIYKYKVSECYKEFLITGLRDCHIEQCDAIHLSYPFQYENYYSQNFLQFHFLHLQTCMYPLYLSKVKRNIFTSLSKQWCCGINYFSTPLMFNIHVYNGI